jgi:hypothetical protein
MNEHADAALLIDAYYKIASSMDETSASFIEAAPDDPQRQLLLQSKLMTAVVANFLQSMPSLTPEQVMSLFAIAVTQAANTYEPAVRTDVN